jgi:hypothetical protein
VSPQTTFRKKVASIRRQCVLAESGWFFRFAALLSVARPASWRNNLQTIQELPLARQSASSAMVIQIRHLPQANVWQ